MRKIEKPTSEKLNLKIRKTPIALSMLYVADPLTVIIFLVVLKTWNSPKFSFKFVMCLSSQSLAVVQISTQHKNIHISRRFRVWAFWFHVEKLICGKIVGMEIRQVLSFQHFFVPSPTPTLAHWRSFWISKLFFLCWDLLRLSYEARRNGKSQSFIYHRLPRVWWNRQQISSEKGYKIVLWFSGRPKWVMKISSFYLQDTRQDRVSMSRWR